MQHLGVADTTESCMPEAEDNDVTQIELGSGCIICR